MLDVFILPEFFPANIATFLETIFLLFLLFIAVLFVLSNNILFSLVMMTMFSLVMSFLYILMYAPDVAMTEAAVGAALTTILPLTAMSVVTKKESDIIKIEKSHIILCVCIMCALILAVLALQMPKYGSAGNIFHKDIMNYYITNTGNEIGITSVVAAILASYRGFDTLGETFVIFTAGMSVYMIIMPTKSRIKLADNIIAHDILVNSTTKIIIPIILIYGLYIQIHGEISPGGGFQAGAIIATTFVLYLLVSKSNNINIVKLINLFKCLSVLGVLMYFSTGLLAVLYDKSFLNYSALTDNLLLGQKIGIFTIELGVGLTVSSVLTLLYAIFLVRSDVDRKF